MVNCLALVGATAILLALIPSCSPAPAVTDECRSWKAIDFKRHILAHMRLNDPLGVKQTKDLTTEGVILDGNPRLDDRSRLWSQAFHVEGSRGYYALIECDGYTELSAYN